MRQLWISNSGQRRKGTRLDEMKDIFSSGITAKNIEEPLYCCPTGMNAIDAKILLKIHAFDTVGIKETKDGPVLGYVNQSELNNGQCIEHKHDLIIKDLISNSTPLIDMLPYLKKYERVFVITGNEVSGIITRADLQKPPVRVMIFGFITLFEMHMTHHINQVFPKDSWNEHIVKKRIDKAKHIQILRKGRNEERDLLDCLQFCDKREIIFASEKLMKIFGVGEDDIGKLEEIENLRNSLAHSQNIKSGVSWEQIIDSSIHAIQFIQNSENHIDNSIKHT